jgi:hypothetical protein
MFDHIQLRVKHLEASKRPLPMFCRPRQMAIRPSAEHRLAHATSVRSKHGW